MERELGEGTLVCTKLSLCNITPGRMYKCKDKFKIYNYRKRTKLH